MQCLTLYCCISLVQVTGLPDGTDGDCTDLYMCEAEGEGDSEGEEDNEGEGDKWGGVMGCVPRQPHGAGATSNTVLQPG